MPAQLLSLSSGPNILLDKPILLLGRHPECDIQIESRKISRRHCCIAQVGDHLLVRDLGSTNGIRINGERVNEGRLDEGAELTIGNNRYRLTWDAAVAAAHELSSEKPSNGTVPAERDEDDMLEACDKPMPLPDPPGVAPKIPFKPPSRRMKPKGAEIPPILPSDLHLAPNSEGVPVDSHPSL